MLAPALSEQTDVVSGIGEARYCDGDGDGVDGDVENDVDGDVEDDVEGDGDAECGVTRCDRFALHAVLRCDVQAL